MVFVLLDSALSDRDNKHSYLFLDPVGIITCYESRQIDSSLEQLEQATKKGLFAAGFMSYETGKYLQGVTRTNHNYSFPLLWYGLFKKPVVLQDFTEALPYLLPAPSHPYCRLKKIRLNTSEKKYKQDLAAIKELIAQGQVYQVNYTLKYKFNFSGSPLALYRRLRAIQPVSYSAFINTGEWQILSFSPELFFRRNKKWIYVKPMKGTAPLIGSQPAHTAIDSQKNKAENLMITDLLRNDLGRISETGSVHTYDLFKVQKFSTLWQMTSSVKSRLTQHISLREIFSSLFPSGSVTGAPKLSAIKIIAGLEKETRKIYTGAIGYIGPDHQAVFNVAIRTLLLRRCQGEMGVGGGITWDSDTRQEWEECKLKGAFLTKSEFQLIETLAWSAQRGILLIELHLDRLQKSADFFGFPCDREEITRQLAKFVRTLAKKDLWKIRLLLSGPGALSLAAERIIPSLPDIPRIAISSFQTDPDDPFLYHKTTERKLYNREHKFYQKQGYYDVLFTNNQGQITEGASANIFIEKGSSYYTPPISCGLLPGVFRQYFMQQHKTKVKEKPLSLADLRSADSIFLTNAVRGMIKVTLTL